MSRAEHAHVGFVLGPCMKCGLKAWQHRTRPGRVDTRRNRTRPQHGNGARAERREVKTFIGLDGEGVTRPDGTHDYVLLTVGKESLVHRGEERLTWREIFPFLYERFLEDPYAAYVGYYLGYDFTQWIRTLSENRAESLCSPRGIARRRRKTSGGNPTPFPVHVGDELQPYQWEIDTLGMRKFKIRPGVGSHDKAGLENPHRWMHICDVGAFFQQSFLKTLKEFSELKDAIVTPEEYALIEEGKSKRASAVLDDDMIKYNLLECELLGRVMPLLNDGFRGMGIELSREKWFGPGQAAQAWLQNVGAPSADAFTHEPKDDPCRHQVRGKLKCGRAESMHAPPWAREVGRFTYFGGWFEIFCHGLIPGTSYEYDVNSAYPDQIARLPCLLHGKWDRGEAKSWNDLPSSTLVAVRGNCLGKDPRVGSMPHRTRLGAILHPMMTSGWYWLHELQAAKRAGVLADFEPLEWVSYEGCNHPPPLSCMRDLYLKRLEFGKKTPRGKAAKLVYNSGYGKFAQSVGSPKFGNGIYASLITTGCRCRILDAIATHPTGTRDLLMVATDGVYFRTPHPGLEISKDQLGKWDADTKSNLTLFMPGLYWDDKAREALKEHGDPKLKSRGVPGRDMARKILAADELFAQYRPGDEWPKVELSIAFSMVTVGQALDRGKWDTCGTVYSNAKRIISADPFQKRQTRAWRDGDLLRSDPYRMAPKSDYASTPYDRHFGDELREKSALDLDVTPDGGAHGLLLEGLGMKG